jgi:uncharacterized protein (DUF433 family)
MDNLPEKITVDPHVQHGKPVIRGTRVPVARLMGGLAGGMTFGDVAEEYGVTAEDTRAALAFAGKRIWRDDR